MKQLVSFTMQGVKLAFVENVKCLGILFGKHLEQILIGQNHPYGHVKYVKNLRDYLKASSLAASYKQCFLSYYWH